MKAPEILALIERSLANKVNFLYELIELSSEDSPDLRIRAQTLDTLRLIILEVKAQVEKEESAE